jgi:hypothetical protein
MLLAMFARSGMVSVASPASFVLAPKAAKQATYVLICNSSSAYAYHDHVCSGLARCTHGILKVTEKETEDMGRVPCKICY